MPGGGLIPAVIGGSSGKGAGVIRLALDGDNKVMASIPGYLDIYNRLYSSVTPDPAAQAIVDAARLEIGAVISQVIGRAEADMTRDTASAGSLDSNLGNWVADVIKNSWQSDFAIQHAGGLRTDIAQGLQLLSN